MQPLIITTTCRNAPADESSGYLYIFDPKTSRVIQKGSIIEPPYRDVDPNPRGGLRGGKGIALRGDEIFLANSVAVFRFNKNWDLQGVISHPACAGIHDILIDSNECLWVTSARNDLLFKFDLAGNILDYIDFRRQAGLQKSLAWNQPAILSKDVIEQGKIDFRDPRSHDLAVYDGAHLNSISQFPDGRLIVSLGFVINKSYTALLVVKSWLSRHGVWPSVVSINNLIRQALAMKKDMHSHLVVQPVKGKCAILLRSASGVFEPCLTLNNATAPAHSVLALPDGTAIYLNTTRGEIVHFEPDEKSILFVEKITDKFLRGVARLSDEIIILGTQNGLILYHLIRRQVVERYVLPENEGESVFAIHTLDDRFSLPPVAFEEQIGNLVGFNSRVPIFR